MSMTPSQKRYYARKIAAKRLAKIAAGIDPNAKTVRQDPKTKHFLPGNVGNPLGNQGVRSKLTQVLDEIASTVIAKENLKKFRAALQKQFNDDPVAFVKGLVSPFLPRNIKLEHSTEEGAPLVLRFEVVGDSNGNNTDDN